MKKFLKYLGITIGVIILVIVIAAVVLSFVINPNDYRGNISRYVKNKTGRTLTIKGDISLSFFPWLGAKVGKARLSNAPGFGNKPFAELREMDVNVRVLPLFTGTIKVGKIEIDGLRLNLERNAQGKTNWADLVQPSRAPTKAPGNQPPPPSQGGGFAVAGVRGMKIDHGAIIYTDMQHHRQYRLTNVNVNMGKFVPGKPFPLKFRSDFAGTNPAFTGHGTFQGEANLDLMHKVYNLNDAEARFTVEGQAIPGHHLNAKLTWRHAGVNLNTGAAALKRLRLHALGLVASTSLTGRGLPKSPTFSGPVKLADFSPRQLLTKLGKTSLLNTADPTVLRHASGSFALKASANSVALRHLKVTLDASHITGALRVPNIKQKKLVFNLNLDKLDADRYLPKSASKAPPSAVAAAEKPAASKPAAGAKPAASSSGGKPQGKSQPAPSIDHLKVPVQRIRKLNIDGKLHVGTLKAFQITTTDADVTITAHDGKLQVDPLHAKLYGGSYDGSIEVNAQGATPSVSTNETVSQVRLGGLAQALFKAKRLTGTGNMKVALQGQGKTVGDIRRALNGKLSFALKNGAISGIDIWGAIRRAYALIKGRSAPASNGPARTQFADLSGTGTIDNGVLHNHNLLAKLPFLRVTGSGSIDLVQTLVDYDIKAKVVKTPEFDQNKKLDQLAGITIPLKIDGNLSDMHVLPDLAAALKGKVKQKVEKALKKKLQNLFHLNKKHNKSSGHSKPPGHASRLRLSDSESLNPSLLGDDSVSLKPSPSGRG